MTLVRKLFSGKRLDLLVMIGFLGLGSLYAYLTRNLFFGKPLFVFVVYTVLPSIYLGLREKKNWKKITIVTLLLGGIFAFFLDFIAEFTLSWSVVSRVFTPKILGVVPADNMLAYMMMTLATTVFYEHFLDDEKDPRISSNLIFGIVPGVVAVGLLLVIYFACPGLLHQRYPYLCLGLAAIIPPIIIAKEKPKLIRKMVTTAFYFFVMYFIIELFAVDYGWWIYTGDNYIGWLTIFGRTFPFEEFFFWMMFYAASLVSYYELFIDDLR